MGFRVWGESGSVAIIPLLLVRCGGLAQKVLGGLGL